MSSHPIRGGYVASRFGVLGHPKGPFLIEMWTNQRSTCGTGDIIMKSSHWSQLGRLKEKHIRDASSKRHQANEMVS